MQKYNFVEINLVQLCLQTLLVVGFVGYHLQTLVICTTFVVSSPTISKEDYIHNHRYVEITTFRNSHVFFTRNNQKKHLTCIYWETNISYHIKFKLSPDKFWQVTNEEIFQFFCHLVFPPLCVMYQTNKNHN